MAGGFLGMRKDQPQQDPITGTQTVAIEEELPTDVAAMSRQEAQAAAVQQDLAAVEQQVAQEKAHPWAKSPVPGVDAAVVAGSSPMAAGLQEAGKAMQQGAQSPNIRDHVGSTPRIWRQS